MIAFLRVVLQQRWTQGGPGGCGPRGPAPGRHQGQLARPCPPRGLGPASWPGPRWPLQPLARPRPHQPRRLSGLWPGPGWPGPLALSALSARSSALPGAAVWRRRGGLPPLSCSTKTCTAACKAKSMEQAQAMVRTAATLAKKGFIPPCDPEDRCRYRVSHDFELMGYMKVARIKT